MAVVNNRRVNYDVNRQYGSPTQQQTQTQTPAYTAVKSTGAMNQNAQQTMTGTKNTQSSMFQTNGNQVKNGTARDFLTKGSTTGNIQAVDQMTNGGNSTPAEYESPYKQQLDDLLNKITGREKFQYEFNSDPLFQYYSDLYQNQGKQAMMDTMGQASQMTGGYGNSYAASVGNQAYQDWLSKIYDKGMEFRNAALEQYQQEGNDLYNQFNLLASQDDTGYNRWRDAQQQAWEETKFDEETRRWQEEMDRALAGDKQAQENWEKEMDRLIGNDQAAREQWQKEFERALAGDKQAQENWEAEMARLKANDAEDKRRWEEEWRLTLEKWGLEKQQIEAALAAMSGGSDSGGGPSGPKKPKEEEEQKPKATNKSADGRTAQQISDYVDLLRGIGGGTTTTKGGGTGNPDKKNRINMVR